MIVLITGLPGAGKTLYALNFVKDWAATDRRPVFFHGIKDLKLPWTPISTRTEKIGGADVEVPTWWDAPKGAIVVVDEAQSCGFGVRQRGLVPEWAQLLETHRHRGVDLVFITQDPSLIDSHDRRLMERHFHAVRAFGMQRANIHEFKSGVRDNVAKIRNGSILHKWKYPKEAFTWYTSAEVHTHKRHVPMRVWLLLAIPFVVIGLSWLLWTKINPYRKTEQAKPGQPGQVATSSTGPARAAHISQAEFLDLHVPRVPGLAYTSPVYDDVTKPVEAPYPAACVIRVSSSECRCYTQQGTRLAVPADMCKQFAEGGFFVAWQQKPAVQQSQQQAKEPAFSPALSALPSVAGFSPGPRPVQPSASILPPPVVGEQLPPGRGRPSGSPRS